ncbi:MAG: DUF4331 family protein [candidate division Zixibacteria bacterium]|nr:DUF4331 family protein [candidate division Zixibacteria bacterium]
MKLKIILLTATIAMAGLPGCDNDNTTMDPGVTYVQTDRMAIPAINTALIPTSVQKDAFNVAAPVNDEANFRPVATTTITNIRAAVNAVSGFPAEDAPGLTPTQVATALIPDVVTINFANPVQFPNGRRLTDDVIDAAVGLVLNRGNALGGAGVGDAINSNDATFLGTFPFLAPEN